MNRYVIVFSTFIFSCLLAFVSQVVVFSPISPELLVFPPLSKLPTNNILQEVVKLGEGLMEGPEDVVVDKEGVVYTTSRDGWIKRMHKNGSWENWHKRESDGLLGLAVSRDGSLIVCDTEEGLLKVNENGVLVLASEFNGSKIKFADEVIESSDGTLYFSVASTKFNLHEWFLDVLEAKPHGRLLKYDPSLNETSLVLDGLCFTNGVALSKDEDYLVFCETWKFRCIRYWLKGANEGKTEIFIDNLPGGPDNINLAPDGTFWIAILHVSPENLRFVHASKTIKYLAASSPSLTRLLIGVNKQAMAINVATDGKILKKFDDPNGKIMSFVTSAVEFEDNLYLGSLNTNFAGKLSLKNVRRLP